LKEVETKKEMKWKKAKRFFLYLYFRYEGKKKT